MINSMQQYYSDILEHGEKRKPRGLETVGLTNQVFTFTPGEVFTRPRGNIDIGFVELLQFISGTFSIDPFKVVAPNARLDLFTHQSAYGPRVGDQLQRAIDELIHDIDSRRAVVTILHPTDTPATMPCTLSAQFQVVEIDRAKSLIATWTMRSSDLVWGLGTDIIQFGGISMVVANCIGVHAFECIVNAGNSHIYTETRLRPREEFTLLGEFTLPDFYTLPEYRAWANSALDLVTKGTYSIRDMFIINKKETIDEQAKLHDREQAQPLKVQPD